MRIINEPRESKVLFPEVREIHLEEFEKNFELLRKMDGKPYLYAIINYDVTPHVITHVYNSYKTIGLMESEFTLDAFKELPVANIYKEIDFIGSEVGLDMVKDHPELINATYNYIYPISTNKEYKYGYGEYIERDTILRVLNDHKLKITYNAEIMTFRVIDIFNGYNYPELPRFFNSSIDFNNPFLEKATAELRKILAQNLIKKYFDPREEILLNEYISTHSYTDYKKLGFDSKESLRSAYNEIRKRCKEDFYGNISLENLLQFFGEFQKLRI